MGNGDLSFARNARRLLQFFTTVLGSTNGAPRIRFTPNVLLMTTNASFSVLMHRKEVKPMEKITAPWPLSVVFLAT